MVLDRNMLSQRIASIQAEISRLNSALYAMDTTNLQRYPDNYEVLSTDAPFGPSGSLAACGT